MSNRMTLAQAVTQRDLWLMADQKVASGQSYTIEDGGLRRTLTRADAGIIAQRLDYWERKIDSLEKANSGRSGITYLVR